VKTFLFLSVFTIVFSGCATIKKQQNIGKIMHDHIFDVSADKLYVAAEAEFKKMYVPLTSSRNHQGSTQWLSKQETLGSKAYTEKDRFVVTVAAQGDNKSRIFVIRELKSDFNGAWSDKPSHRMYIYEFNIQKKIESFLGKANRR